MASLTKNYWRSRQFRSLCPFLVPLTIIYLISSSIELSLQNNRLGLITGFDISWAFFFACWPMGLDGTDKKRQMSQEITFLWDHQSGKMQTAFPGKAFSIWSIWICTHWIEENKCSQSSTMVKPTIHCEQYKRTIVIVFFPFTITTTILGHLQVKSLLWAWLFFSINVSKWRVVFYTMIAPLPNYFMTVSGLELFVTPWVFAWFCVWLQRAQYHHILPRISSESRHCPK